MIKRSDYGKEGDLFKIVEENVVKKFYLRSSGNFFWEKSMEEVEKNLLKGVSILLKKLMA